MVVINHTRLVWLNCDKYSYLAIVHRVVTRSKESAYFGYVMLLTNALTHKRT